MTVLAILFGWLFTVACCTCAGALLLKPNAAFFSPLEYRLFAFVTGSALLSALVFVTAVVHVVTPVSFLVLGIVLIALSIRYGPRLRLSAPDFNLPRWFSCLVTTVIAVFVCIDFVNALAPEASPDGSTYHLGLVARYAREHGFGWITTDMYANLSQGIEMLYLFAFPFGKHSSASLIHFTFLLALAAAMLLYSVRIRQTIAGCCGAILVLLSPVVTRDATTAYIDVAVACLAFCVFFLLEIWREQQQPALLLPIGLLTGFCFAAKYTAVIAVPFAAIYVVAVCLRRRQPWMKNIAMLLASALCVMLPWMLKNSIVVGNPLSPFLNALFPNPYVRIAFEQDYLRNMRHYPGITSMLQVPWEACVRGAALQGFAGPLFLLAPLCFLSLRSADGRRVLFACAWFLIPYAANIGTRFLIPALPFLAFALALAIATNVRVSAVLIAIHAVLSLPFTEPLYCDPYTWRISGIPVTAALRIQPEVKYLESHLGSYRLARFIEAQTPPSATIFCFDTPPEAYCSRTILTAYKAGLNNALSGMIFTSMDAAHQPTRVMTFSFPTQRVERIRLLQTARKKGEQWTVSEVRILSRGEELPRRPEWRLSARPNPWEVQWAFDGSWVTQWKTWESLRPGMYIDVDFARPEQVDSVLVHGPRDDGSVQLRLDRMDRNGTWTTLSASPTITFQPAPEALRRDASVELKANGIDYIAIADRDYAAHDINSNPSSWGLLRIGRVDDSTLYLIK